MMIACAALCLAIGGTPARSAVFKSSQCWFAIPADRDMTCGHLLVPESRAGAAAEQREISLAVVVFEPDRERHEPVVFLSGGPGQAAGIETSDGIDQWWQFIDEQAWLHGRRLIVFDQRGVGASRPALDCSAIFKRSVWDETLLRADRKPDFGPVKKKEVEACRNSLVSRSIDLSAFNTRESAADLADLRTGLGIDHWVLYGVSYGTEVGLVALAANPEGISAAVLDSVLPPRTDYLSQDGRNLTDVLSTLEADCRQHRRCKLDAGTLSTLVRKVVEQLNAAPVVLRIEPDAGDRTVFKRVSGDDFLEYLFEAFYDNDFLPLLPLVIRETSDQNYRPLANMIATGLGGEEPISDGLNYSVTCSETRQGKPDWKTPGYMLHWASESDYSLACPIWLGDRPLRALPDPTNAHVPVLFLSGEYDPGNSCAMGADACHEFPIGSVRRIPGNRA